MKQEPELIKVELLKPLTIKLYEPCERGCCLNPFSYEFEKGKILECEKFTFDAHKENVDYKILTN